jgi:DNA-binding transcriptional MerR regulator
VGASNFPLFNQISMAKFALKSGEKIYYSISEVSQMTGIKPYVLRFWETEFPSLKPKKNRAGNRSYQQKDIQMVNRIKHLLYEEGHTIEGARNKLKETKKDFKVKPDMKTAQFKNLLFEVRKELKDMLKLFA